MLKSGTNMVYEYPENSKAIRLKQHEAALAAAKEDDKLSPETGKPISKSNMIKFGVAFLVFGVLWMVGINAIAEIEAKWNSPLLFCDPNLVSFFWN